MSGSKLGGLALNVLRLAVLVIVAAGATWVANRAGIVDIPAMDRVELPFLGGGEEQVAPEDQQGTAAIELVAVSYLDNGRTMISVQSDEPIPEGEFVGLVEFQGRQAEFSCEQLPEYPDRLYCSGAGLGPETAVEFQLGFEASRQTLVQRLRQTGQLPAMEFALGTTGAGFSDRRAVGSGVDPIASGGLVVLDTGADPTSADLLFTDKTSGTDQYEDPLLILEEATVSFEDPIVAFEDPIVAFEDPIVAFEDPIVAFEDPLVAFEDPIVALGDRQLQSGFDPAQGIWGVSGTIQPLEESVGRVFGEIEGCLSGYDSSLSDVTISSQADAYNSLLYMAAVDQQNGREALSGCPGLADDGAGGALLKPAARQAIAELACASSGSLACLDQEPAGPLASSLEIFQAIRSDEAICWYALGLPGEFESEDQMEELASAVVEAVESGQKLPAVCGQFYPNDSPNVALLPFLPTQQAAMPPEGVDLNELPDRRMGSSVGRLRVLDGCDPDEEDCSDSAFGTLTEADLDPQELYQLCGESMGQETTWSKPGMVELISMLDYRFSLTGDLTEECRSLLQTSEGNTGSAGDSFDDRFLDELFAFDSRLPSEEDLPDGEDVFEQFSSMMEDSSGSRSEMQCSMNCAIDRILGIPCQECSQMRIEEWPSESRTQGLEQVKQCALDLGRPEPLSYVDHYELGIRANRLEAAGQEVSDACRSVQSHVSTYNDEFDFGLDLYACAARRNACLVGVTVQVGDEVLRIAQSAATCGGCQDFGERTESAFSTLANACAADFGWLGGEMDSPAEELELLRQVTGWAGLLPSSVIPESCKDFMGFYATLSQPSGFPGLISAAMESRFERIASGSGAWSQTINFTTPPAAGSAEREGGLEQIEATDIPEVIECPPGEIFSPELGECQVIN